MGGGAPGVEPGTNNGRRSTSSVPNNAAPTEDTTGR
jgi:hypothetical protein